MMIKKKDIFNVKEELTKEIISYIIITKEKGFEDENVEKQNEFVADFIYTEWNEMFKDKVYYIIFIF